MKKILVLNKPRRCLQFKIARSGISNSFGSFPNELDLNLLISSCFLSLVSFLKRSSSVKIISISADNDLSSLRKYISAAVIYSSKTYN